jgi:hypothetical protein
MITGRNFIELPCPQISLVLRFLRMEVCYKQMVLMCVLFLPGCVALDTNDASVDVRSGNSEAAFQELDIERSLRQSQNSSSAPLPKTEGDTVSRETGVPPREQEKRLLIAVGYGDLSKGLLSCRRVADIAARAELAKLIRVRIKEHSIDRLGERTGQEFTQIIEVTREEDADEILQGVKITERAVNRSEGICSSKAELPTGLLIPATMRTDQR